MSGWGGGAGAGAGAAGGDGVEVLGIFWDGGGAVGGGRMPGAEVLEAAGPVGVLGVVAVLATSGSCSC